MVVHLLAPVIATLRPYIALSKTRLETLGVMLAGLANARTVNLTHLASPFPGKAHHSSNSRRLHRFFSVCWFDEKAIAGLIVRLLNLSRSRFLALDRTNWKLGRTDIHVLVLAIITPRFKVPICGFSSNIAAIARHHSVSICSNVISKYSNYLRLRRCLLTESLFVINR